MSAYFEKWQNGTKTKITQATFVCSIIKQNKLPMFSLSLPGREAIKNSGLPKHTIFLVFLPFLSFGFLWLVDPYSLTSFNSK